MPFFFYSDVVEHPFVQTLRSIQENSDSTHFVNKDNIPSANVPMHKKSASPVVIDLASPYASPTSLTRSPSVFSNHPSETSDILSRDVSFQSPIRRSTNIESNDNHLQLQDLLQNPPSVYDNNALLDFRSRFNALVAKIIDPAISSPLQLLSTFSDCEQFSTPPFNDSLPEEPHLTEVYAPVNVPVSEIFNNNGYLPISDCSVETRIVASSVGKTGTPLATKDGKLGQPPPVEDSVRGSRWITVRGFLLVKDLFHVNGQMPPLTHPNEILRRFDVIRQTCQHLVTKISPHYRNGKWVKLTPLVDAEDVMLGYNKERYWMRSVRCDAYENKKNQGILDFLLVGCFFPLLQMF